MWIDARSHSVLRQCLVGAVKKHDSCPADTLRNLTVTCQYPSNPTFAKTRRRKMDANFGIGTRAGSGYLCFCADILISAPTVTSNARAMIRLLFRSIIPGALLAGALASMPAPRVAAQAPADRSLAKAPTDAPLQITWEVKNRFRLFREQRDFLLHAEALRDRSVL